MACQSQTQIEAQLDAIEAKLRSGIESVSSDGTSTKVNLAELRKERDNLKRLLATFNTRRPVASRIKLGGF